jgi:hypothetical protein
MGPPWNLWKYESKTAADALDKLWEHVRSKKSVQGTTRVRNANNFLIDMPIEKGDIGKLVDDICSPKTLDERVSRLAQLCRRVAEEDSDEHVESLKGISSLLQRLGESSTLSEEAKSIAKEAAKIAQKRLGNRK